MSMSLSNATNSTFETNITCNTPLVISSFVVGGVGILCFIGTLVLWLIGILPKRCFCCRQEQDEILSMGKRISTASAIKCRYTKEPKKAPTQEPDEYAYAYNNGMQFGRLREEFETTDTIIDTSKPTKAESVELTHCGLKEMDTKSSPSEESMRRMEEENGEETIPKNVEDQNSTAYKENEGHIYGNGDLINETLTNLSQNQSSANLVKTDYIDETDCYVNSIGEEATNTSDKDTAEKCVGEMFTTNENDYVNTISMDDDDSVHNTKPKHESFSYANYPYSLNNRDSDSSTPSTSSSENDPTKENIQNKLPESYYCESESQDSSSHTAFSSNGITIHKAKNVSIVQKKKTTKKYYPNH